MVMDQITEHSFSCYNNCSHSFSNQEHYCNRIYFYTNCNYLFGEKENPNTMFARQSCQVNPQSRHDHYGGKASRKNGCLLMDMFVFRQLNILMEHPYSIEYDSIFTTHLQSKHPFCMDAIENFFKQLHILMGHL